MNQDGRTREEQLREWKARRAARPQAQAGGAGGPRPAKLPAPAKPHGEAAGREAERRAPAPAGPHSGAPGKENARWAAAPDAAAAPAKPGSAAPGRGGDRAAPAPAVPPVTGKPVREAAGAEGPGRAPAPPAAPPPGAPGSLRKPALSPTSGRRMESSYSALLGRFETLKRESLRAPPPPPPPAALAPAGAASASGAAATACPQALRPHSAQLPGQAGAPPGPEAALAPQRGSPDRPAPAPLPAVAAAAARDSVALIAAADPAPPARAGSPGGGARVAAGAPRRPEPAEGGGPVAPPRSPSAAAAASPRAPQPEFEPGGRWEAPSLAQAARELFGEPGFAEQCERGLTMQLRRTRDGATAESRIAELAGAPRRPAPAARRAGRRRATHLAACAGRCRACALADGPCGLGRPELGSLWAAPRGSNKLTDIPTTVRARGPLRPRAGLVKLLRRCLTQLTARARSYVDTCVRFEKEAAMQARRAARGPPAPRPQHAL
jgi:hypothetical protein